MSVRIGLAALVVTAAAAGACATMWFIGLAVGAGGSACVLATVVALSLGRRTFATRADFARSAALLPVIGLAAGAVGWLLMTVPPLGAALFVAGMSIPIWMRRFGPRVARLGALIALPLTAVLVAPVPASPGVPAWLTAVLVLMAGVVAALWVAVARELLRLIPGEAQLQEAAPPPEPRQQAAPKPGTRRLPASTRMAIQMAVALSSAFVVGWAVFPDHVVWVVLTAFLVCSGNRGRADVLHKSALRVLGALGGTIGAVAIVAVLPDASGPGAVVAIFLALFAGTWLRTVSYAYWAVAVTLALSLLQELTGAATIAGEAGMLAERLVAIVVGAVLGIAASWFVLPVKSVDVLRRRLADVLTTLGSVLSPVDPDAAPGERARRIAAFRASVARVEQLAPAHRAARVIAGRRVRAIDCIEAAAALPDALDARLADRASGTGARDGERLRGAIATARRSLAAPPDLARVHDAFGTLAVTLRGGDTAP
ncbi:FUSC family protein [Leifsonia virtsii]|uniref:FUSC family protein n=1 Tax=Leifsonia virtsii TaxID=3035915 RepID=A0ABT8J1P6_9MICO|nr:FUSC family protein [Leifsonia virtsii]MDN4598882.1 FUSC family protein [Leifsonia virtsii]